MKPIFRKALLLCTLALGGLTASAQGLENIIVEEYHVITQADVDYLSGAPTPPPVGAKVYRVYVDMAPNYKFLTVTGGPTAQGNPLDFSTTTTFWNNENITTPHFQASRFLFNNAGNAFDSYLTIHTVGSANGSSAACGTGGGTGSFVQEVGVERSLDLNANLSLCNKFLDFPIGGTDGHIPATTAGAGTIGVSFSGFFTTTDFDALTLTSSSVFQMIDDGYAITPAVTGVNPATTNRVLIGQFTTDGTFSFHINVALQSPLGVDEQYTWTNPNTAIGQQLSTKLIYPQSCAAPVFASSGSNSPVCAGQALNLNASATGDATITYSWAGPNGFTSPLQNPSIAAATTAATGTYTVTASNGCAPNATATVSATVNAATNWYADTDGDGFGAGAATLACTQPVGSVANNTDLCATDANKQAPGACGCGVADVAATYYADTDGDGFGAGSPIAGFTCNVPAGTVTNNTDLCATDANKQAPGACGCGVADVAATYYADTDGDGFGAGSPIAGFTCSVPAGTVTNNTDNCPNIVGVIGSSCNDNNPNTSGDAINASCQCVGSAIPCPDDGNPCTSEVVVNGVCTHPALPDTDGDGTCDLTDGCPSDPNKIAAGACGCGIADVAATYYADTDGDGFGAGSPIAGFTCNVPAGTVTNNTDLCATDANKQAPGACGCGVADVAATYYADTDGDGFGAGSPIAGFTCSVPAGTVTNNTDNCPNIVGVIGSTCDDNNPNTSGDQINASCECAGSSIPCPDDGNPCTGEVVVNGVCTHPALPDTDGDGTCDLTDGCPSDPNKIAAGACGCGVADVATNYYADTDGDGFGAGSPIAGFTCNQPAGTVTNNTDDCPELSGRQGDVCNDNNNNTVNDVIGANCVCAGTLLGNDCEGVPGGPAQPGTACDDGLTTTGSDTWSATCQCVGLPFDCAGVAGGTALPGTPCNDGLTTTGNDTWNGSCVCVGQVIDCLGVAGGTALPGTSCNDQNGLTQNDIYLANCTCQGTPIGGCTEIVSLTFETDASPAQTSWEIIPEGGGAAVCAGVGSYAASTEITETCCLPQGCYALRVLDSAGDGITNGGYVLTEQSSSARIIDNRDNFSTGSVSAISGAQGFCLPLGTDRLIASSCDKLNYITGQYLVATENTAVSATWVVNGANNLQPANSGYEFWIFDPNGSYSFRRFRSHNVSDGYSPATATRAAHMKINGWLNTVSTPHIPANVLMNVRVRGRIGGVNAVFGAACQMKVDPARAACPLTSLLSGTNPATNSCNVNRNFGSGSTVYAQPASFIPAVSASLIRYQFRFRSAGFEVIRQSNTYILPLYWTGSTALQCGVTYSVDVRVSKDGGATWCIDGLTWGPVCTVTINPCGTVAPEVAQSRSSVEGTLTMYPNPNRGNELFISLTEVAAGVQTASVDIYDMTGKRVAARTIAVQDGFINQSVELNGDLAGGLYMVNITAGDKTYTERLVIQP